MKHVAERIRKIIFLNDNNKASHTKSYPFDFVQTRKGMLRELMISKEARNLIGLLSPALGEGLFFVWVTNIDYQSTEEVISFQKYNLGDGRASPTAKLSLRDITGVCPFITSQRPTTVLA